MEVPGGCRKEVIRGTLPAAKVFALNFAKNFEQ
jgi:hypothetical protein